MITPACLNGSTERQGFKVTPTESVDGCRPAGRATRGVQAMRMLPLAVRGSGTLTMSRVSQIAVALLSTLAMPLLQSASQLDEPTYDDTVYVNCAWGVAAIFPRQPLTRDFTYTVAGWSAPARQFYIQDGANLLSVTVARFSDGPAVDQNVVAAAAIPLRERGEIRFAYA